MSRTRQAKIEGAFFFVLISAFVAITLYGIL